MLLLCPMDYGLWGFFFFICVKVSFHFFLDLIVNTLFSNMLFNLHVLVCSLFFFCLISILISLLLEMMLDVISIFLNFLTLLLCANIWSTLENVPCVLERNVYFAFLWCNFPKISSKSTCCTVLFQDFVSLQIFCLGYPFVDVIGVLKPLLWLFLISPFMSIKICFKYLSAPTLGTQNVYKGYIVLLDCSFYHYVVSFFVSYYSFCFTVHVVWYKCCYLSFFNFYLHKISFPCLYI